MDTCFVIQPFDKGCFDKRYKDVFIPAIQDAGLKAYRVDEDPSANILIDDIEDGIRCSKICLAEISTDNPNVWFELGYAIAVSKEVVLVCSEDQKNRRFPFDVRHRKIIEYKNESTQDFKKLRKQITERILARLKKLEELPCSVESQSPNKPQQKNSGRGCIREDQPLRKGSSDEILRLLKRNEQLEAELIKCQAMTPKEAEYLQGDDLGPPLAVSVVVDTKGTTETKKLTPTWDHLFYYIGPSMMNECTEEEMMNKAMIAYYNCLSEELRKYTKEDKIVLSSESKNSFLFQFLALKWIEKGTKKRSVSDNARYWCLTPDGETHLIRIKAKKRVDKGYRNEQLNREQAFHGTRWDTVHDGYFSDPDVAVPLVKTVKESASCSKPDKIIDLGGGTGFLLSQLRTAGIPSASLFYVDASPKQLEAAKSSGFAHLYASVDSFLRRDIGSEEGRYLFMMRSVLHYLGEEGLRQVLRHIRSQAKPGEYFVHQTASFENTQDANCLNALYKMMRTKKWYPTVAFLRNALRDEGWQVISVLPASSLRLKHDALKERYSLTEVDILQIRDQLSQNHRVSEDVFRITDDGFCAFLHYSIYVCTPS